MIKLYQFSISHYCEKIRWVLDFKNIEHEIISLIPGLHIGQTKKFGTRSAVPIIQNGESFIQGSTEIIDYLEDNFPQNSLTPEDETQRKEVQQWEAYVDENIGIPLRVCVYHILLEHPEVVKPFFAHNGPWYGRVYLFFAFSKMVKIMRRFMNINNESYVESKKKLNLAVDKLNEQYKDKEYLVDDNFSRADLSAAALLAPLFMPKEYGLDWPKKIPAKLQVLMDEFKERITWAERIYKEHR